MADFFNIEGPAYVSFSGGRTSSYLLWRLLQSWGGAVPPGVEVFFANTGEEMPATLDFVRDVSLHWSVPITWIEYRLTEDDKPTFGEVTYETASREGQPFDLYLEHVERLCAAKEPPEPPYLPGPGNRFCTTELKIRPMKKAMLAKGYEHWTNIVGIRHDEPKRWRKLNRNPPERWDVALPLVDAQIDVGNVRGFWKEQPFDLGIAGDWEGNCDACHLKMPWKVARVFRDHPGREARWLAREKRYGKWFRPRGPSIAHLVAWSKNGEPITEEDDEWEIKCTGCTD